MRGFAMAFRFGDLKLRWKVFAAVMVPIVVALAITGALLGALRDYHASVVWMYDAADRSLMAERINERVNAVAMDSRRIATSRSLEDVQHYRAGILRQLQQMRETMDHWASIAPANQRDHFERAQLRVEEFTRLNTELVSRINEDGIARAREFGDADAIDASRLALNRAILDLVRANQAFVLRMRQVIDADIVFKLRELAGASVGGVFVALCFAIWMTRRYIVRPIVAVTAGLSRLAVGDQSITITGDDRRDEMGELARAFNALRDQSGESPRLRDERSRAFDDAEGRTIELPPGVPVKGEANTIATTAAAAIETVEPFALDGHGVMRINAWGLDIPFVVVGHASNETRMRFDNVGDAIRTQLERIMIQLGESATDRAA